MDIRVDSKTAVVFDLDDTLYNELDYLRSAYRELSEKLAPDAPQQLFSDLFSRYRNKENVFQYVSETYGIALDTLLNDYRSHTPRIAPFPSVMELLGSIKAKAGRLGIITDGRSNTQRNKLHALGILDVMDYIVISEEIGSEKPDEQNYRAIERELNCVSYYYIGDNFKKDFLTPNQLGWGTIGLVDNGRNIHSNAYRYQEETHRPQHLVYSLADLIIT